MRYVTLIAVSDEFDNTPGLAVKGTPTNAEGFMADRNGVLVAHDLLEHVNGVECIGSVWDELEAMGAIWHVRGRWGDLAMPEGRSMHSIETNLASDISRMFREVGDEWVPPEHRIGRTRRVDDEDVIDEVIDIARRQIIAELTYEDGPAGSAKAAERREAYLLDARHRFRIGLRKARRRYGHSPKAYDQFVRIRDAVAGAVKHIDFEGQEFRLGYGGGEATCREAASPDY